MSSNGSGSLRNRVHAQRGGTEVATASGQDTSLAAQIRRMTPEFELAMPRGMEAAQLVRDAITCLRKIKKLDQCDPESLLGALMTTAQLGLRPAVLGHAWPLPYWDRNAGRYRAQLIIGYQGYVELAYRSGKIGAITSRVVREGEKFSIVYREDRDELVHEPTIDGLPGEPRAFYSTGRLVNGGYTVTEPWSVARMAAHRDQHAPRNRREEITGPWVDNFTQMGQKTMVLVNCRLLPKSAELAIAMEADGAIRVDLTPTANAAEVSERAQVIPGEVEHDDAPASDPDPAASARGQARRQPRQEQPPAGQPAADQGGPPAEAPTDPAAQADLDWPQG